jgi:2-C-methyl-D-erythritol 4-phosphate cytidylyltransferase
LLVAAGRGARFGTDVPKQFLELGYDKLYEHAARVFEAEPVIADWWLMVPAEWRDGMILEADAAGLIDKLRAVVIGGATRQQSVWLGLQAIAAQAPLCTHVLIHDAARPFLTSRLVRETAAAALRHGAATVALPVTDTLVRAGRDAGDDLALDELVDRTRMWSVQTPQAFAIDLLRRAHEEARAAGRSATDDGGLVRALGLPVALVPGNWWNMKVTVSEDLLRAELLLQMRAQLEEQEADSDGSLES